MRHTPGPWRSIDSRIFSDRYLTKGPIATVHKRVQERANARLIASAPDMLEMLQELSEWLICPDCSAATVEHIKGRIDAVIQRTEE